MSTRLLEPNIKALILNHMISSGKLSPNVSIINEFTVDNLSRRADLAIIDDNKMIAFEIKSEADTLKRLVGQVNKYLEYFDKVIIVAATKHIKSILETVPANVAVWELVGNNIRVKQRGRIETILQKERLISLMNSNELQRLAKLHELKPVSKNRNSFSTVLLNVSANKLKKAALKNIKTRYQVTNSNFWDSVLNRDILISDIELLSPYIRIRNDVKFIHKEKEKSWKNWELKLKDKPEIIALYEQHKELTLV